MKSYVSNFIEIGKGFRAVRSKKWSLPLTLTVALTTDQHSVLPVIM